VAVDFGGLDAPVADGANDHGRRTKVVKAAEKMVSKSGKQFQVMQYSVPTPEIKVNSNGRGTDACRSGGGVN
jgi:hypothetical protein